MPAQSELVVDVHAPLGTALLAPGMAVTLTLREGRAYIPADFEPEAGEDETPADRGEVKQFTATA